MGPRRPCCRCTAWTARPRGLWCFAARSRYSSSHSFGLVWSVVGWFRPLGRSDRRLVEPSGRSSTWEQRGNCPVIRSQQHVSPTSVDRKRTQFPVETQSIPHTRKHQPAHLLSLYCEQPRLRLGPVTLHSRLSHSGTVSVPLLGDGLGEGVCGFTVWQEGALI